ncbi:MAG: sporulation and cell division protein SsgA [Frankiales bacterium]|jgi:hypothetical protein|nr:sporulation and cell division protein SsgA [Frankiales bacterium]
MSRTATVSTELELRLVVPGGPPLPVRADLRYQTDDPWAIRVAFHVNDTSDGRPAESVVEWIFARQLLVDGFTGPVGDGDVRVWPAYSGLDFVINLAMASPSGSAVFEVDRDPLVEFLQQTHVVVPSGAEENVVDLDTELTLLLLQD